MAGESVQLTADQGIVQLTDNGDGTYQAQYTAAEIGGSVTNTATSSSRLSQSIKLQVLGVSNDLSSVKAVGKIALPTGEDGQVEVTVISPVGKPAVGRQVTLRAEPGDRFVVKSSTLTDASGVATVTFTAGKSGTRIKKLKEEILVGGCTSVSVAEEKINDLMASNPNEWEIVSVKASRIVAVSYTHLTLPTNREV
mgnify:CR=1 FL=1